VGSSPTASTMNNKKEYKLMLTEMEAAYLNASVVDFFHKMRAAVESETVVLFQDDRYRVAKDLWIEVEKRMPVI
jgi:hypothetical protein